MSIRTLITGGPLQRLRAEWIYHAYLPRPVWLRSNSSIVCNRLDAGSTRGFECYMLVCRNAEMSLRLLCFPERFETSADCVSAPTKGKESKMIEVFLGGYLLLFEWVNVVFPQMTGFASSALDVYCLLYIKDVCNTWIKPFVSILIYLRDSCSAAVGCTWLEICCLCSWEP